MSPDCSMRPSDDDRGRVVGVLCHETALGRLTIEEFVTRADAAWGAWSGESLWRLTADLPTEVIFAGAGADVPCRRDRG